MSETIANLPPSATGRGQRGSRRMWTSVIMLTLVTLLTFANGIPDALVFDDKAFVGPPHGFTSQTIGDAFTRDLWNKPGLDGSLYRPLLLIEFEIQSEIFGSWKRGYHLANILLHLLTTLVLFGLLRYLLNTINPQSRGIELCALLAALVFAVHPTHTEVVNSVFNKSSMYVTLAAAGGLWWLLANLGSRPARAWLGFALAYCAAILIKESALVLPGIAVAMIVLMTEGDLKTRIRRFLPVFLLLIPIGLYFWARALAVAPEGTQIESPATEVNAMFQAARVGGDGSPLTSLALFGQGLKFLVWPYPLRLYHELPGQAQVYAYLALQVVLGAWAVYLLAKGRPALAAGLAFYYIALFPALRVISFDGANPHMAERYLYLPSAGLAIALAFGLRSLTATAGRKWVVSASMAVLLILAAITWDRNSDWVSEVQLFETDYHLGHRGYNQLRILVTRHMVDRRYKRVTEICDENRDSQPPYIEFVNSCAMAYLSMGRKTDAVAVWEEAAESSYFWIKARYALAQFYLNEKDFQKAADQFVAIINRVKEPADKRFYQAELLVAIYSHDPVQLEKALSLYREALGLNPGMDTAVQRIDQVNELLTTLRSETSHLDDP